MHRRISLALVAALVAAHIWAITPGCPVSPGFGAPVPKSPAPAELTTGQLLGDWTMKWGSTDGSVSLGTNGDYFELFGTSQYVGYWFLNGVGEIVIVERWFDPATGATGHQMTFKFKVTAYGPKCIRAECGGIVLVLTRQ